MAAAITILDEVHFSAPAHIVYIDEHILISPGVVMALYRHQQF